MCATFLVPGTEAAGETTPSLNQSTAERQPSTPKATSGSPVRILIQVESQIMEQDFIYRGIREFIEQ